MSRRRDRADDCAEAMRFYQRVLGGKLDMMTRAQSPMAGECPPGSESRIRHARLALGGRLLMASDTMVGHPYEGKKGFSLALAFELPAEAKRVCEALADGGRVVMPLGETFWAAAFGMLVDRFGTSWMVNAGMKSVM